MRKKMYVNAKELSGVFIVTWICESSYSDLLDTITDRLGNSWYFSVSISFTEKDLLCQIGDAMKHWNVYYYPSK